MSSDILADVLTIIERYQMLALGDTVIVGLSGGADSMALISILNELKKNYNLILIAAHINHGLRGEEALRDENFAAEYCKTLGIDFHVLHADVPTLAKQQCLSFEACGRTVRYNFFTSIAREVEAAGTATDHIKIATAHNAGDVAETFLFNLARGSGLRGLTSIPPKRTLDGTPFSVIRPLISSPRSEIEAYLEDRGISHITDSTNLDDSYARNRIRLRVLPDLRGVNDACVTNILRCAENLREDDEFLSGLAKETMFDASLDNAGEYNADILKMAPKPILSRIVSELLQEASGVHAEKTHIEKAIDVIKNGGKAQLTAGVYIASKGGVVYFKDSSFVEESLLLDTDPVSVCVDLNTSTKCGLPFAEFEFHIISIEEFSKKVEKTSINHDKKYSLIFQNALDYGKMKCNFIMRNRHGGDKFKVPGRNVTKTLKNLFNEVSLPLEKRYEVSILECDGEIAWMSGFGPSEDYKVTKDTKTVLIIEAIGR